MNTELLPDAAGRLDIEARRNAGFTYEIAWTVIDPDTLAETIMDLTGFTAECDIMSRASDNTYAITYTASSGAGTIVIDTDAGTTTFAIPTGTMRSTFEARTYEHEFRLADADGEVSPENVLYGDFRVIRGKP